MTKLDFPTEKEQRCCPQNICNSQVCILMNNYLAKYPHSGKEKYQLVLYLAHCGITRNEGADRLAKVEAQAA